MTDNDLFQRFRIAPNRRFSGDLELELRSLVRFSRAIRGEITTPFRLPWRERLAALRCGFTSSASVIYRLGEKDPLDFISDLGFALRGYKINGFWNQIIGNKLVLGQVLAGSGIPHPRILAVVVKGRLLDREAANGRPTGDVLDRLSSENAALVFRPDWSGGGEGVFFFRKEGAEWSINGVAARRGAVDHLVASLDRYVVTAYVQQASYAAEIFPGTANTVRVLTLWDREIGPFVAAVVHRFGTSRSFPLDNWHMGQGGVCAAIDPETGALGRAVTLDSHLRLEWMSRHPETGHQIEGVRVPHLRDTLEGILRAARCFPGGACVGWDAVTTEEGFSILEANSPPGLFVWQVHAPLLADERTARFFASHGFPLHKGTSPAPPPRPAQGPT